MLSVWGIIAIWEMPTNTSRKQRRTSAALIVQWIQTAWNDISQESITKGFRQCCVNDMNRVDDYVQ